MRYNTLSSSERWIIKGIPVLFIAGIFMHFLYDISGYNAIIGAIAAVNESVWEHLKLVPVPLICWWAIYYIVNSKKNKIDKNKWFTGTLAALLTALITMPLLYYFYTEAFGLELLVVDIIILFLAIIFGQLLGLHFYKYSKGINPYISICILIVLIIIFIMFTFCTPHLPMFMDSISEQYGI